MAKGNGFIRYKAYNFVDKDPIIDIIRTIKKDAEMNDQEIRNAGGPSVGTLRNWFNGKTRRPQFATIAAAGAAMGLNRLPITAMTRAELKEKSK